MSIVTFQSVFPNPVPYVCHFWEIKDHYDNNCVNDLDNNPKHDAENYMKVWRIVQRNVSIITLAL